MDNHALHIKVAGYIPFTTLLTSLHRESHAFLIWQDDGNITNLYFSVGEVTMHTVVRDCLSILLVLLNLQWCQHLSIYEASLIQAIQVKIQL